MRSAQPVDTALYGATLGSRDLQRARRSPKDAVSAPGVFARHHSVKVSDGIEAARAQRGLHLRMCNHGIS